MKKTILFALTIAVFASCANESTNNSDVATTNETANEIKKLDPVCNMEYNEKWTLSSVHEADTIHFCSPVCKETFDKNPASFIK